MDWRAGAEHLRSEWLRGYSDFARTAVEGLKRAGQSTEYQFLSAVRQCGKGKPANLIKYLRSERELPSNFRERLADLLDGKFKAEPKKKKRGRRPDESIHTTAWAADMFYREWLIENKRRGIKDFGFRAEMKSESVRIVQEMDSGFTRKSGKVLDLLRRPAWRRK